jgi:hypothetical protein
VIEALARLRRATRLELDRYTIGAWLLFASAVVYTWRGYVRSHESIYLLGPRRVFDPGFLSNDISWSSLPPTTFVFDHLVAPLWAAFDDFGIVTIGRLVTMALLAWSLASLSRAMKLPVWSVVVGFIAWALWRQTVAACGKPVEGFQPKSFAYPSIFFSLAFAMRGQFVRSGVAAGVGTAFHIIVGGWGCLALFLSMLCNRQTFAIRDAAVFVVATAPFIAPLVLIVALFHTGGLAPGEGALMNEIYVKFAQPTCLDPDYYMEADRRTSAMLILPMAPLLIWLWPRQRGGRLVSVFVGMLIAFYALGMLAHELDGFWLLKLYPLQLANAIPALFLVVVTLALLAERPRGPWRHAIWAAAAVVTVWMIDNEDVATERIFDVPKRFVASLTPVEHGRQGDETPAETVRMYEWIRSTTPEDSVFLTAHRPEFWSYAERSQVASFRHPPHDRSIIEWKERLEAMNGFRPFASRGAKIRHELAKSQSWLSVQDLVRIRETYGATHYLTDRRRGELAGELRHRTRNNFVYDIRGLKSQP